MLKKTILVVGALAAATSVSSVSARASGRSRPGLSAAMVRHVSYRGRGRHVAPAATAATTQPAPEHYAYLPSDAYPQTTGAAPGVATPQRSNATPAPRLVPRRSRVAAAVPVMAVPRAVPTAAAGGGQVGAASYYSGGRTASGGSVGAATCAHRTLPFGTKVLVTNLSNAHQAVLTVNDRGPFVRGRIIDVSTTAASALGMRSSGTAEVRVQVVGGPG